MGVYGSPDLINNSSNQPKAYCRFCGRVLYANAKKCPDCKKNQDKSRWYLWVTIFILLLSSCSVNSNTNYMDNSNSLFINSSISESEFKEKCKTYSYEELARNPQNYVGENVKLRGKVIQIQEYDKFVEMRVNITEGKYDYSDTIYCLYKYKENESRILEGDIITLYGICNGTKTYTTVLGNSLTIPLVKIEFIEMNN